MNRLKLLMRLLKRYLSEDSRNGLGVAKDEKGAAIVLLAVMVTVLLGMGAVSVDAGMLFSARQKVANAADAAALGAAQLLPDNPARALEVARQVAAANGADPALVVPEVGPDGRSMSIQITSVVPLAFARALNRTEATVAAASTATVGTLSTVRGAVPFGVPRQDFVPGGLYTLKDGSGGNGQNQSPGNYHALALGGRGATIYQNNTIAGYSELLRVGDRVETETGNMHGATETGVRARLEADDDDYDNDGRPDDEDDDDDDGLPDIEHGSKRLLLVPIVDGFEDVNGRGIVTVVGFGAFYLKGFGPSGTDEVVGRFVRTVSSGAMGSGPDFGTRVVKLSR